MHIFTYKMHGYAYFENEYLCIFAYFVHFVCAYLCYGIGAYMS